MNKVMTPKQRKLLDKLTIMSNTKHTPGPWLHNTDFHLYRKDEYNQILAGDRCISIEHGYQGFSLSGIMTDADAKLIAAAPGLLRACDMLLVAETPEQIIAAKEFAARIIKKATE